MASDLEKKYKQLLYHVQTQQQVLMTSSMLHKNFGIKEVSKVITDTLIEFVGAVTGMIFLKKNGDQSGDLELSSCFGLICLADRFEFESSLQHFHQNQEMLLLLLHATHD